MKFTVAILKNETAFEHELWLKACNNNPAIEQVDVIDLTADNWLEQISKKNYYIFLLKPPGRTELLKRLYDERVFIISETLKKKIYPSLTEVLIYENKRFLRDWLMANKLPHPQTNIFFSEREAKLFLQINKQFPVVAKTNIGASGKGVVLLKSSSEAIQYLYNTFNGGIKSPSGPKLFSGSLKKKISKLFSRKDFIKQRLNEYAVLKNNIHKDYVFFQQFIPHTFEWRCVRIGDSYFAHKKIAVNNKSSGTLIKGYDPVPHSLLHFIKSVTEKTSLSSVSIDVFENEQGYLINEVQCFFGQSDPYQMLVNDKPGRYRFINSQWVFEEGMFNTNECYDLRLEHAITTLIY
jgi:glutathione synthase/RimK-type ligase-like ATP-grasp enzyme